MNDLISRQAALDALGNIDCSDGVGFSALKYDAINDAVTAIEALPSAQLAQDLPNGCTDTISRVAALSALNGLTEIYLNNLPPTIYKADAVETVKALPSAQPSVSKTEIVGDAISRQAAIKAADSIIERDTSGNNDVVKAMTAWKEYIKGMPPAQPTGTNTVQVDDCISRKAAIDALPYLLDYEGFKGESGYVSKNLVRTMLKGLPPVTPKQPGWIPVTERTPEKSGNYLVTTPDGQVELRYYSTLYRWYGWVDMVAWMPLPKPWEGGQNNA